MLDDVQLVHLLRGGIGLEGVSMLARSGQTVGNRADRALSRHEHRIVIGEVIERDWV
jgi:hypothetical protein